MNQRNCLYTAAIERKLLVEGILGRLSRGESTVRVARKEIARLIGRGIYACQSHHPGEPIELFDVQYIALMLDQAEGCIVATRRSGEFAGETVLIPFFGAARAFFGTVSHSDYRGPQFYRNRMKRRRVQQLRQAA